MPRLRTLKHSFFQNEALAEIEPLGRLLFAGLWGIADRAGRLEDRPRRIKTQVLPYDEADVDALLAELERTGFVRRYAVEGERYMEIVNFAKHQRPHPHEAGSEIPPPSGAPPLHVTAAPLDASDEQSGDLGLGTGDLGPDRSVPTPAREASEPDAAMTDPDPDVSCYEVDAREGMDVAVENGRAGDAEVVMRIALDRAREFGEPMPKRTALAVANLYLRWKVPRADFEGLMQEARARTRRYQGKQPPGKRIENKVAYWYATLKDLVEERARAPAT